MRQMIYWKVRSAMLGEFSLARCAVVIVAVLCSCWGAAADIIKGPTLEYLNAQRTYHFGIRNGTVSLGLFNAADENERKNTVDSGSNMGRSIDCSTRFFRCHQLEDFYFAVPRGSLLRDASYVTAGVRFRVRKCYRGAAKDCSIALVESDCERRMVPGGGCVLFAKGREASPHAGAVTYFFYNARYGVTAFGFGDTLAPSLEAAENAAGMFVLQGEAGLLKGL